MKPRPRELVFDVLQDQDGGFVAECIGENIVTEADTWQELRISVKEAVAAYSFDSPMPESVRLHLIRDEVLVRPIIKLVEPGSLPKSEGKAIRVFDRRKK